MLVLLRVREKDMPRGIDRCWGEAKVYFEVVSFQSTPWAQWLRS